MELQIFKNAELGPVRSTMINGEPYFVGKDDGFFWQEA
jgi:prophage antirepressor-like protein